MEIVCEKLSTISTHYQQINIELQKKYHVGYHYGARGVFYCARMLSEQIDTEFKADNYDDMKKVYSIWICMNAPEKDANTITECSMEQKELYGDFQGKELYDFLSVIIIRLSGKDNRDRQNEVIDMLTVLLSEKMDAETKKRELAENHGMIMTENIEGRVTSMCNLGEGLIEQGIQNIIEISQELGIEREVIISKLVEKYQLSREEAEERVSGNWK